MRLIDFDKLFEEFFAKWYSDNKESYKNVDDMENDVPNVYVEWLNVENVKLDGQKPSEYFSSFPAEELVKVFLEYFKRNVSVPDLLADRIVDVPECKRCLIDVLKGDYSNEVKIFTVNLLNEMQDTDAFDLYISWVLNDNIDEELRDIASEILEQNSNIVKCKLIGAAENATLKSKKYIADILRNEKDEAIFELLMYLLDNGDDLAIYAGYLGEYGDDRAVKRLTELYGSVEINFIEHQELKNSIEMLGGTVPEIKRDFSDDVYYKALKNVK